jgi:hypothetical protein
MNHFEGKCQYTELNKSLMKDYYGNLLKRFDVENEITRSNKNCKFKLKQNRKFTNQFSLKRCRTFRKDTIINTQKDIRRKNFPPGAPENRTQYLASYKRNMMDFLFEEKKENININQFENALQENVFLNKKNLPEEKQYQTTISNKNTFYSKCLDNITNENILGYNYLNINLQEEDLYTITGSTMKTIVESITNSKNKILSNSLNLDGNQSNQCNSTSVHNEEGNRKNFLEGIFEEKLKIENFKKKEIEEMEKANNFYEMNFNIEDFIPDLVLDIDSYNTNINNTVYLNNQNTYDLENIDLIIEEENFYEKNSTKNTSMINSPEDPTSMMSPCLNEENFFFQKFHENNKEIIINCEDISSEKFQFFLLSKKKNRKSFENYYSEKNTDQRKEIFFRQYEA